MRLTRWRPCSLGLGRLDALANDRVMVTSANTVCPGLQKTLCFVKGMLTDNMNGSIMLASILQRPKLLICKVENAKSCLGILGS